MELKDTEYTKDQNNRIRVWATFSVKSIGYDTKTRTINFLEIQDKSGNVRYSLGMPFDQPSSEPSQAVRARRAAADRAAYQPISEDQYWKIVAAYALGKKTKTGGDYRDAWIQTTHAGMEQIAKFDNDVANYRSVNING